MPNLTEKNFPLGTENVLQRDPSERFRTCLVQFYHFKSYKSVKYAMYLQIRTMMLLLIIKT